MLMDLWPSPGPERLPLDSGRGNVEFACVFESVASLAVSFMSECIFWNPVDNKKEVCPSNCEVIET